MAFGVRSDTFLPVKFEGPEEGNVGSNQGGIARQLGVASGVFVGGVLGLPLGGHHGFQGSPSLALFRGQGGLSPSL